MFFNHKLLYDKAKKELGHNYPTIIFETIGVTNRSKYNLSITELL